MRHHEGHAEGDAMSSQAIHTGRIVPVSFYTGAGAGQALASGKAASGPVLYWMHREHRVHDNWALLHARARAAALGVPLAVVWALAHSFLGATARQFGFLLRGMEEVQRTLTALHIPLIVLRGEPPVEVATYASTVGASLVVTDADPLRIKRWWLATAQLALPCGLEVVDNRCVVPCAVASNKREYAARTLRPRVHRLLGAFLEPYPALEPPTVAWREGVPAVDWEGLRSGMAVDRTVGEVAGVQPGESAARAALQHFLHDGLHRYDKRNDPNADAVSGLSPWLHFGMVSAQRVALAVMAQADAPQACRDGFVEELIVRRELAENFCTYTDDYDSVSCFPDWAMRTLDKHAQDARPYLYDEQTLESASTHDPLWNAAQQEMVHTGKMHGYLRMYWAKKILEWTPDVATAMRVAVRLNDRYFLDGRDPNGYTGIAWSMGGVHDRPWGERAVFGTIRYMNFNGARGKFDVPAYVERMGRIARGVGTVEPSGAQHKRGSAHMQQLPFK